MSKFFINRPIVAIVISIVLVLVGSSTDTSLLAQAGVEIDAAAQSPAHNPKTMETNVPGFFVAGTAVGRGDAGPAVAIPLSEGAR